MAQYSYEDFIKRTNNPKANDNFGKSRIRFLTNYLKEDGNQVIVRFPYKALSEFEFCTVHKTYVNGKMRAVSCLRDDYAPVASCPLCNSGAKPQHRFYLKCLLYTTDENNQIVSTPCVWETSESIARQLADILSEYQDLSLIVCKIKRNGVGKTTTYTVTPANPTIYNNQTYPADFSEFNNFKFEGFSYLKKNFEEMSELVGENTTDEPVVPTDYNVPFEEPKIEPKTYSYTAPTPQTENRVDTNTFGTDRPRRIY